MSHLGGGEKLSEVDSANASMTQVVWECNTPRVVEPRSVAFGELPLKCQMILFVRKVDIFITAIHPGGGKKQTVFFLNLHTLSSGICGSPA